MKARNKGLLLVLATAIISGVSIFVNSFAVKGFDSSVFTFSKNILVALFLISVILAIGKFNELKKLNLKQWSKLVTIGLIGGSVPFLLFFKGLQLTSGSTSAFIHKLLFIFIAVLAIIFLKEKLSKGFIVGAILLTVGNFLLLKPSLAFTTAHLFILAATLFWAAENILSKHAVKDISGTTVAFGRMFFGSIFILAFLLATGKASLITAMSLNQYFWIIITSIFLLAYVSTFYNGIKHIKISTAACILSLGAPITTSLAWIFKDVAITAVQVAGIFSIVLGIVSVLWFSQVLSSTSNLLGVKTDGRN